MPMGMAIARPPPLATLLDMTKKRRAAAHFALLFASLAILRLASA